MRRGTSWWGRRCVRYGSLTMSCIFYSHDFWACKCFCSSIFQYTHIYVCVSSNIITLFLYNLTKFFQSAKFIFTLWSTSYDSTKMNKPPLFLTIRARSHGDYAYAHGIIMPWITDTLNYFTHLCWSLDFFIDSHKYVSLNKLACLV
jgi:hypothetical protein